VFTPARDRTLEFEADAFVRRQMGTGVARATSLARLSAAALEHPTPHPLFVWLHREHPPIVKRMTALIGRQAGDVFAE
jgi:STE24 endopeptidase